MATIEFVVVVTGWKERRGRNDRQPQVSTWMNIAVAVVVLFLS